MSSYVDVCPGKRVDSSPANQVRCRTGDTTPILATGCPAGTVVRALMTLPIGPEPQVRALCVPTSVSPTSSLVLSPGTAPTCPRLTDLGEVEFTGTGGAKFNCYPAAGAPAAPPAARPPFSTLDAQYMAKKAAYDGAVMRSIRMNDPAQIPKLRVMSEDIQASLTSMIESLTFLKKETPDIAKERSELLDTLRRIQRDYGAMLSSTDDLETLRRIREHESGEAQRLLMLYLFAFLFVSLLLIVYILYTGRKTDTAASSAPTPAMSPALT